MKCRRHRRRVIDSWGGWGVREMTAALLWTVFAGVYIYINKMLSIVRRNQYRRS